MARNTKSAGQSFREPGTFSNLPSFISTSTFLTPVSPCSLPKAKRTIRSRPAGLHLLALQRLLRDRSPLRFGHVGQGLLGSRLSGGLGNSSKFTKLLQPCRKDVPMQSVPVSPPPITITSLSFAEMWLPSCRSESSRLWCLRPKIHGEVHAVELSAVDGQVSWYRGSGGQQHDVVLLLEFGDGNAVVITIPHRGASKKRNASLAKQQRIDACHQPHLPCPVSC